MAIRRKVNQIVTDQDRWHKPGQSEETDFADQLSRLPQHLGNLGFAPLAWHRFSFHAALAGWRR